MKATHVELSIETVNKILANLQGQSWLVANPLIVAIQNEVDQQNALQQGEIPNRLDGDVESATQPRKQEALGG